MPHTFDRRAFLAGGVALGAGAAMLGSGAQWADAAITNGPGLNGVSTAKPKRGGSVVMGIDTEEGGFDPTTARWDEGGFLYGRAVFDPLAIVTSTGKVQPYLAESIAPNTDYTAYTITLRPGIMFHDGTPLDADALLLNLTKQQSSPLVGPAFAAFIEGSAVSGPLSVTITMKAPWVPFPYYLAQAQTGYIAAPSMLNNPNGTSNPVGTGPFVFQEWIPNSHFTATANPHYWRSGLPYLDSITFKPIIDPTSCADALESGTIDIMHTDTPAIILQFRGNKKWAYLDNSGPVVGQPSMNCLMLNTGSAPFNNPKLRLALAKATSPKQYSKIIDLGVNAPSTGLFVPGTPYYTKTTYPSYDPSGAKALVKQIAKETGNPVAFTLNATNDPEVERAAQYLKQQYSDVGITTNINISAQSALINDALAGKFEATTWRQFGAVDPDLNYVWWSTTTLTPGLALNMARNSDQRIQAALTTGREVGNPATRVKAYQKINEYLAQDVPYIWTDRATWAVVANPNVKNFANPKTVSGTKALAWDEGVLWPTQIWRS
ncbi:MAG: ABC transporter substrate-binding protein [Acidimicrobiales bacterium]